jgi:hypothetical protein
MKINNLLIVIITFLFFSCSTQKSFKKVTQSIEVALPFQDVKSDKDFFRSVQMGKSSDLASAKKIASMNAKEEMTSNIQSVLKSVSDIYTNQVTNDDRIEYRSMFESLIRESSVQLLSNVQVKDEKVYKENKDNRNNWIYWIVLEMPTYSVIEGLLNQFESKSSLKLKIDKKRYEEIFNQEILDLQIGK